MRRRSHGPGLIRCKLAAMIAAHLSAEPWSFIVEVQPEWLRPAQGYWRSDFQADVYRWEGKFLRKLEDGSWFICTIDSWSTMTDCVRHGIDIDREKAWQFNCYAKQNSEPPVFEATARKDERAMIDDNERAISIIVQEIDTSGYAQSRKRANDRKARNVWAALRRVLSSYTFDDFRFIRADRIKTVWASQIMPAMTKDGDAEHKYVKEKLARIIGDDIAMKLIEFDKVQFIERGHKDAPPHLMPGEVLATVRFDIIVPESKPECLT